MKATPRGATPVALPLLLGALLAACEPVGPGDATHPSQSGEALASYLPNGIQWKADDRFPKDLDGDGVRDELGYAYVHPEYAGDGYWVTFDGCVPGTVWSSGYQYRWTFPDGQVSGQDVCKVHRKFPRQDTYTVKLEITGPSGAVQTYRESVKIKDYLIISLGDSYGSGEGAPDIRADYDHGVSPKWANRQCHRSFNSPSARAALALEESDPHTSVTYVSFACSGATINRPTYQGGPSDGFATAADGPSNGSGLLGPYAGYEPTGTFLHAQVDDAVAMAGDRPIDALVISGGGNDVGFGDVLRFCTINTSCTRGGDGDELHRKDDPLQQALPGTYFALQQRLDQLGAKLRNVLLVEYPEIARRHDGAQCDKILQDTNFAPGYEITGEELGDLDGYLYQPLLHTMRTAAQYRGWTYVTGIADDFAGRSAAYPTGHGYCTIPSERWINNAYDGAAIEGPQGSEMNTAGKAHPNYTGYQVMADHLLATLQAAEPTLTPDGTLINENGQPEIYVVYGGARFWIPSPAVFDSLGFDWSKVVQIGYRAMANFPLNVPRDGTLLRNMDNGGVYLIQGGAKLGFASADEFNALSGRWDLVRTVPAQALAAIPDVPRDGALVRDAYSGAIYVMAGGAKLWISSPEEFDALGYSWADVRNVPVAALNALPATPADGTLLANPSLGATYLVHGGAKFAFANGSEFNLLGLQASQVRTVPAGALSAIPNSPRDGTLMRSHTSYQFYVAAGGARILIPASELYSTPGFDLSKARFLPDTALFALPTTPRDGTLLSSDATGGGVWAVFSGVKLGITGPEYLARLGLSGANICKVPSQFLYSLHNAPYGHVDVVSGGVAYGWSFDSDNPGAQVQIHLYLDAPYPYGKWAGAAYTTADRPDVNSAFGLTGTHGFAIPVPAAFHDGAAHTVYAYAIDDSSPFNPWLDALAAPVQW